MELKKGDYIDPLCQLSHFKTKRLFSINKKVREMSVVKLWIKHSAWKNESTKFFILPSKIYNLYAQNKNYLTKFSKDEINLFLAQSLPKCTDIISEKKRRQIKEILKFDLIAPNTVLETEGQSDVPICYAVISGEIIVLKKDSTDKHQKFTHDEKLEDQEKVNYRMG